jgi:hypothetical protein
LNTASRLTADASAPIREWLGAILDLVDQNDVSQTRRYTELVHSCEVERKQAEAKKILFDRLPIFVLFNNYFRVHPLIHLEHLAIRLETNVLDDKKYDYGNSCLLKLLGFSARDLSNLGRPKNPLRTIPPLSSDTATNWTTGVISSTPPAFG